MLKFESGPHVVCKARFRPTQQSKPRSTLEPFDFALEVLENRP